MKIIIFDDFKSYFHFFLGFITPLLGHWALFVVAFYLIYQYFDKDNAMEKIGDLVEFFLGAGGWALVQAMI